MFYTVELFNYYIFALLLSIHNESEISGIDAVWYNNNNKHTPINNIVVNDFFFS